METQQILHLLQCDIHSAVFATTDEKGLPYTCVIDIMLTDENGLYFLTARGKAFYRRLTATGFAALTGMRGKDTLSSFSVSIRGAVKKLGKARLAEIFEKNPYMAKIYPTEKSREALEVFCLWRGEGEYFDLSGPQPYRESFSFGEASLSLSGYHIKGETCIGCQLCRSVCPTGCISDTLPRQIELAHCLHCGNCVDVCPVRAVERIDQKRGSEWSD